MTNTVLREPSELVECIRNAMLEELKRQNVPFAPFGEFSAGTICIYHSPAVKLDLLARAAIERLTPTPEPSLREELVEAANHLADEMDGILPYLAAHNWRIDMLVEAVTNVRSAITASPAEPEEATEAMIEAIKGAAFDCTQPISRRTAAAIYAAMRSAASGGEG